MFEGCVLFLTFLKPVINGTGFYYLKGQTAKTRARTMAITYGHKEFVVVVKILRGEKYQVCGV